MKFSCINVSPAKEKQFFAKGIYTVEDLVRFLPRQYHDYTQETGVLPPDQISCMVVRVDWVKSYPGKTPMIMAGCTLKNGAKLFVRWFHQGFRMPYLRQCVNRDVYICGKIVVNDRVGGYDCNMPLLFDANISRGKRIEAVYPSIPGMSKDYLQQHMSDAFSVADATRETIPYDIVEREHLMPTQTALFQLHFPKTMDQVRDAQERILFDDLLYFALHNEYASRRSAKGSAFQVRSLKAVHKVISQLPYELTPDQKAAVDDMLDDARNGRRINALVQGDVGCGKSIIAFLVMVAFVDSGYQAAIMAPTQVLARQHYEDLTKLVEPLGYKVVYMGGADMKAKERREAVEAIASGEAQFIVGTHAVASSRLEYHNLGVTVADEEHRFGVAQRAALIDKAAAGVHGITMSATPIPRTLAQVVYGNTLQLYSIQTMPAGRKPVITGIAKDQARIFRFVSKQVQKGHQVYVVCPMIDQNDDMEGVTSVEEVSELYEKALTPAGIRVATLTGRDKKEVTESTIAAFKNGEIDVLISTTVIEVGVNVPNATAIIITNAERFGLASLHQLRGRVGRSDLQSYCVLQSTAQTEQGRQRLEAMVSTTNGFEIAQTDLKIRGAGDFLGTKQSGENQYLTLMLAYPDKYKKAQEIAAELLDRDNRCTMLKRALPELEAMAG